MDASAISGAILTIDLDAIVANWRLVAGRLKGAEAGAVVKADAYGLGADKVGPALARAGCRQFFVAHISEGIALRRALPDADIHVLNGLLPGTAPVFAEHRLIPVLNSLGEIEAWKTTGPKDGTADIHIDTGMRRLGLSPFELRRLAEQPDLIAGLRVGLLISHLACADEPEHPLNREQLNLFREATRLVPSARRSFANSSGIFLGDAYHADLVRPGSALYGIVPVPGQPNPMAPVVRLQAKVLQARDVDAMETVGYGATHRIGRRGRLATVAVGYADGYLRSLSNRGNAYLDDIRVPIVGRVSMDLITLDVTALPASAVVPGTLVDLIGPHQAVDDVGAAAGSSGYEILTGLGRRYHRVWRGGA
ncbi:MAG: alanine racemase [Rhodospirillales bacterium]|nr:alanine racemase [Rhodospirillales bacterium]